MIGLIWRTWIKDRRLHWLRKYKKYNGCANCGYDKHPLALDLAHIDQMSKHSGAKWGAGSGISKLYVKIYRDKQKNAQALKNLIAEVRKCKVLCKNCHVIETFENREFNNNMQVSKARKLGQKQTIST